MLQINEDLPLILNNENISKRNPKYILHIYYVFSSFSIAEFVIYLTYQTNVNETKEVSQ